MAFQLLTLAAKQGRNSEFIDKCPLGLHLDNQGKNMSESSNRGSNSNKVRLLRPIMTESTPRLAPSDLLRSRAEHSGMKFIPWDEIWASLAVAKMRGNGEMIEVFYDTLFKEAVFDDQGAWSLDLSRRH